MNVVAEKKSREGVSAVADADSTAAVRSEVVDILAGAVLVLLVSGRQGRDGWPLPRIRTDEIWEEYHPGPEHPFSRSSRSVTYQPVFRKHRNEAPGRNR